MEIVFSVVAFLVIVCVMLAPSRRIRRITIVAGLVLLVAELAIWFGAPQFPRRIQTALRTNIAQTSAAPEFAELRTRTYAAAPERVARAVAEAIGSRPDKWVLAPPGPLAGDMHATVKVLMFTDDVFVHLERDGGDTRVDVRSQSRVGKGDFGENRRHIQWLLEQLDARLGAPKP